MRKSFLLLAVLLTACNGSDTNYPVVPPAEQHVPEIANLSLSPDSILCMDGGGTIALTIEFAFIDDGSDIQSLNIRMPDGSVDSLDLADLADIATGTASRSIDISTVEAGSFNIEVWLVDTAGDSSNHLTASYAVEIPMPEISALEPDSVVEDSGAFELTVTGDGFLDGATVTWEGADRPTTFVSDTRLKANIAADDVAAPGVYPVRVRNPDSATALSNLLHFTVTEVAEPEPEPQTGAFLISATTDGLPPNGPSVNGGLDWEANHVIFASRASNLVAGDTNGSYDLFVRRTCLFWPDECDEPSTTRLVMGLGGAEPNGDIGWTTTSPEDSLAVSFNGRFAAFVSSASNLVEADTNDVDDVFIVDTCATSWPPQPICDEGVVRVSLGDDGRQSTMPASQPAVADDGRYVVFVSEDPNLVTGDTNFAADVFLRDTCRGVTDCTPSTIRVSVASQGQQAIGASGEPSFSGRYVAFSSQAGNLVAGDTNGLQDIFLRDTCIGATDCIPSTKLISIGRQGEPADGASSDPQVSFPLSDFYSHDQHGRFVAFVSAATNLVADDTNGALDVFERDLCAGEPSCTPSMTRVSVTSAGGQIAGDSWSPDHLRWDGEVIPFVSEADNIVPGDTNGVADVFLRHHCPYHLQGTCTGSTRRLSIGFGDVATDGPSYAPRLSYHLFGSWAVTYISEASNILEDGVAVPNDGIIYLDYTY